MPCGAWINSSSRSRVGRAHAERIEIETSRLLVEQAQHDALAVARGQRRDAHVDRAAADAQRDRPSCGSASRRCRGAPSP
jgi:hypothetical protein